MIKLFLTGEPGSGKSTVMRRIIEILKKKEMKVGGIITPEIRENGKRTGFKVVDVYSGEEGRLANIHLKDGISFGKYRIDLEEFEKVALHALSFAMEKCDVVCIDEIGKMELFSKKFKERVEEILKSDKPVVCVLHRKLVKTYEKYGKIFWVNPENRERLPEKIVKLLNGPTRS